jgi:hypothetical protein
MDEGKLTAEYCRVQAAASLRLARIANDPIYERSLRAIAHEWEDLADRLEADVLKLER